MSFWSVDGEDIRDTVDVDKALPGGGDFELFPDGTRVLALVTDAGTKEKDGNIYAYATMEITKPEGYAGRKLFPSFWVFEKNSNPHWAAGKEKTERAKAVSKFTKFDLVCGGKLTRKDGIPTGDDIAMAFTNKQVGVTIKMFTTKQGEDRNYYSDYWLKGAQEITPPAAKSASGGSKRPPVDDDDDLDSIPF